jgi:hypothetical protein
MTLKEKIEERIRIFELNKFRSKKDEELLTIRIQELQWVLSELEKMTCQNCAHNAGMDFDICWALGNIDDYCCKWEEK